jgi:hypothetical protein
MRVVINHSIIFLFLCFFAKAQKISTLFVDSVIINIDNRVVYNQYRTYLKFIPGGKSGIVTLFDDGIYNLQLNFKSDETDDYNHLLIQSATFYINNIEQDLTTRILVTGGTEWNCSGMSDEKIKLITLDKSTANFIEILIKFRTFGFAPRDTLNYPHTFRHGEWIGISSYAKEVSVNYEYDRKHGPAKVIYYNGTVYNTNFINGTVDNYGYGEFENFQSSSFIIPNIVSMSCDNTPRSFYLKKSKKYVNHRKITRNDDLSIDFVKKGINTDSVEYKIQGNFVTIMQDTMIIRSNELEVHDFYKVKTDSLHFHYRSLPSGFQKVPISDIKLIKKRRSDLQTFVVSTTLLSLISAAVVSPVISIQKQGFNTDRFLKVSGTSLGVTALSITVGVVFGSEKFQIKPTAKKKVVWKIKKEY